MISRRSALRLAAVGAAGSAIVLAPVSFAQAAPGRTVTKHLTGTLSTGAADFVYLPIHVPRGVEQISVAYTYDKPVVPAGVAGNSCDIGIFDERGLALGGKASGVGPAASAPSSRSAVAAQRLATCPDPSTPAPGTSCSAPTKSSRTTSTTPSTSPSRSASPDLPTARTTHRSV